MAWQQRTHVRVCVYTYICAGKEARKKKGGWEDCESTHIRAELLSPQIKAKQQQKKETPSERENRIYKETTKTDGP
jgi:hypothetical protein